MSLVFRHKLRTGDEILHRRRYLPSCIQSCVGTAAGLWFEVTAGMTDCIMHLNDMLHLDPLLWHQPFHVCRSLFLAMGLNGLHMTRYSLGASPPT